MVTKEDRYLNITEREVPPEEGPAQGIADRPPRINRAPSARDVIQTDDWWLWELIGILISAAALSGIAGLLLALDDKPLPYWSHTTPAMKIGSITIPSKTTAITPNSLLSLLSTVGRICVLIPITKGLAQLKWVWFAEQESTLSDFEAFDNATRGLTGSMFLMWKLRFRSGKLPLHCML